ncbi:hypothetical protein [Dactylosporangium sp. CA-092794]|uniref:hypothetical protein n=1 Tax=Dactylosporangium sp. CA-092794 TaxID=3239929 RepID=UPI003D9497E5
MTDFDPAAAFPELLELRAAVTRRDWPAIAALFAGLTDPEDQAFAAGIVAEVPGSEGFLGEAAQREPGTLARTLYGARLIVAGWRIRTAARAKDVSREQFEAFHDHLRRAERVLIEVTAEDPANAPAWARRITTNRGLQLGQNEARRRYDRLSRHVPDLYAAQSGIVQQFCPKWSGSVEKVYAFGMECMRGGRDGSLGALALLEAHFEISLELGGVERDGYWRRPQVRAELDEAAHRSVRHPAFRATGYRARTAHGTFALAYHLAGDRAAARPHFEATGGHGAGAYWQYISGDETAAFKAAMARAMKA